MGFTAVAACADAVSYLGLGHVFPANMTGNTVLLGVGVASGDVGAALRSATALGTFLVGAAAVGAALPSGADRRGLIGVVAAEVAMVGALSGWWLGTGATAPVGAARYALIALAGAAMGAQSGVVRALGAPVATTYLTGTWTALSTGVAHRLRGRTPDRDEPAGRPHLVQACVVTAYVGAAFGAAFAYSDVGSPAAVIPLAGLLVVGAVARERAAAGGPSATAPG